MAPLPPLPENNTDRYFLDMDTAVDQYTIQVRTDSGITLAAFDTAITPIFTAMGPLMPQTFVSSVRFQAADTVVSSPVASEHIGEELGSGTATKANVPRFLSFQGRSGSGRRVSWFIFGVSLAFPEDYRIPIGLNANIENVYFALSAADTIFQCVSLENPTWYAYANCGFNSYKERRNRRS
jgi:hypothetical protein